MTLSKTQVDKLGERLRDGAAGAEDLHGLDEYRRSFATAQSQVLESLRTAGLQPSGRSAKVTRSIAEKLRRESIRLSQVQDIAGCRVVVADIRAQDKAMSTVSQLFPNATVFDRRKAPSHGYRAVHFVVRIDDRVVEIQVRSELQHEWAALSEKFADLLDSRLKYGEGDPKVLRILDQLSGLIRDFEQAERYASALSDGPGKESDLLASLAMEKHETLSLIRQLAQGVERGRIDL